MSRKNFLRMFATLIIIGALSSTACQRTDLLSQRGNSSPLKTATFDNRRSISTPDSSGELISANDHFSSETLAEADALLAEVRGGFPQAEVKRTTANWSRSEQ